MSRLIREVVKPMSQLYKERQHLQHPIPRPLEIRTTGKALTVYEWNKFYNNLTDKLQESCEHKKDGTMLFLGEYGLDAAITLQNIRKYKDRFHFIMTCSNESNAIYALQAANEVGLNVSEVHYKNNRHDKVISNHL